MNTKNASKTAAKKIITERQRKLLVDAAKHPRGELNTAWHSSIEVLERLGLAERVMMPRRAYPDQVELHTVISAAGRAAIA